MADIKSQTNHEKRPSPLSHMIRSAALCVLLLPAALIYCFFRVFYVPKKEAASLELPAGDQYDACAEQSRALIASACELPYEPVYITAQDGTRLYGRYYHRQDGAPLQILFHGYRSSAIRDFCGGLNLALESGCNALLVDERAHGESGGRCLSFGILERRDCLDWVRYAEKRFGADTPIILCGISMGASTVLMASELDLPANVRGILADCPYSSPKGIIEKVIRDMHYPLFPVYPVIRLAGKLLGGFDLEAASPIEALKANRLPVLIIHGEEDRFVPCEMSRELAKVSPLITLVTVPGAGHGLSYMVDYETYAGAVKEFLAKALEA